MRFDATSYEMGRQAGGGGGGSAVIESITITQNGITTAPSGVDGYSPITVEVAAPAINLQNKSVSANGTYTADQGYDGLGQVVVNVAGGQNQYDLTGNIDGVFASPQATQWFGANYAYINSISNITSMKATFSNATGAPNKAITLSTNGAKLDDAFKNAYMASLPSISGKVISAKGMLSTAQITNADLSGMTYDPDFSLGDNEECRMMKGSFVVNLTLPAALSSYHFSEILAYNPSLETITEPVGATYAQKVPQGWTPAGAHRGMFSSDSRLRNVPSALIAAVGALPHEGDTYYGIYRDMCFNCNSLDELVNLPISQGFENYDQDSMFWGIIDQCNHLAHLTFASYQGTVDWDGQSINFRDNNVGYGDWQYLPAAKEITDQTTYDLYKNDPDGWTKKREYSRYNHDSAVETINSLPELETGHTCWLALEYGSGSATDAGAVGDLTTAEIAVAAAKGWTISYGSNP